MNLAELRTDVVILTCGVSAGIHGALVPGHFGEGTSTGLGFAAATVVLVALAVTLTRFPASTIALGAAAAVFVGLLASYAFAVTTGLPVLHADPEPIDGLALFTKAVEGAGVVAALSLLRRRVVAGRIPQPKGTLT